MEEELDHKRYEFACNECGQECRSIEEYIQHCKNSHPKLIGTALT
ncbi:MAG: hypothetical protein QXX64_06260 [Nitrososphaera sp.]